MLPPATIIPSEFGPDFLDWFRARTEKTWAELPAQTPEEELAKSVAAGVVDSRWQQGTRWQQGLAEHDIAAIEQRWHLTFPPDYRLFLQRLHTVDRPMHSATYLASDSGSERDSGQLAVARTAQGTKALREAPSFYDWQRDDEALRGRFAWLWEGLQFDVEHNVLWPARWGSQPATLDAQDARVRELVEAAPRLIPVFSHRYLLAEPCVAGNPVLSVYQSDIVVYGADLREYLLIEFADLLRLSATQQQEIARVSRERFAARSPDLSSIPFWGELL